MSYSDLIPSSVAYPFVIGCSVFGILWGIVNVLLVSYAPTCHPPILCSPAQLNVVQTLRESRLLISN